MVVVFEWLKWGISGMEDILVGYCDMFLYIMDYFDERTNCNFFMHAKLYRMRGGNELGDACLKHMICSFLSTRSEEQLTSQSHYSRQGDN
jgi:hypothetical protein